MDEVISQRCHVCKQPQRCTGREFDSHVERCENQKRARKEVEQRAQRAREQAAAAKAEKRSARQQAYEAKKEAEKNGAEQKAPKASGNKKQGDRKGKEKQE